jgi:ABC-type sugar transport system ATPase subunit
MEAMTMADRIGVISEGSLVQVGTPYEIYHRPVTSLVSQLVGSPEINLFSGIISDGKVIAFENAFEMILKPEVVKRLDHTRREVQIGIRPENIRLSSEFGVKSRVYGIENMGIEQIVTFNIGRLFLKATLGPEIHLKIDSTVRLDIDQEQLYLFHHETGKNCLI